LQTNYRHAADTASNRNRMHSSTRCLTTPIWLTATASWTIAQHLYREMLDKDARNTDALLGLGSHRATKQR